MINGRAKGGTGEREFCKWLQEALGLTERPCRNLEQVRAGGADIIAGKLIVEVKRRETLSLRDWWIQAKTAARDIEGGIPVVAYRQNRQPWRFLISAKEIGLEHGFIQLEELEFKQWAKNRLQAVYNAL